MVVLGMIQKWRGIVLVFLDNIMTDFDASYFDSWSDEYYEALAELYSDCLELISC